MVCEEEKPQARGEGEQPQPLPLEEHRRNIENALKQGEQTKSRNEMTAEIIAVMLKNLAENDAVDILDKVLEKIGFHARLSIWSLE